LLKADYAGLKVEMPKEHLSHLNKFYDYHLNKMTAGEKMNFLENTALKRKSLIVSNLANKKRLQKSA
jgi:hypothetical protein